MRKNEIELDISLNCSIKNFLDEKETLITITVDESILDDEIDFKSIVSFEVTKFLMELHYKDYWIHNQKVIDDFEEKRKNSLEVPIGNIHFKLAVELRAAINFDITKIVVRQIIQLEYLAGE